MSVVDAKRLLTRRLGYEFNDSALVEQALTHRSYSGAHNERLEFLGDSIVNFLIGEALFLRFPDAREGDLSRMRAGLVKGPTLATIAREYQVGDCLNLGPGERKSGGHRRESILADALEALVGAMYIDGGLDVCRQRVLAWFGARLDGIRPGELNKDAKTRLQEWLQARQLPLPVYNLRRAHGEEHNQQFEVECEVGLINERFSGEGSSRRAAEQAAAAAAMSRLQELQ